MIFLVPGLFRRFVAIPGIIAAGIFMASAPGRATAEPAAAEPSRTIQLSYQLYGRGFHVLDVVASLRLSAAGYSIQVHDHTVGFMGMMIKANVTSAATGRFVSDGVQPLHFQSDGYSRGAQRDTQLDYVGGDPVVRVLTPKENNRDPVDISSAKGSIDSLSVMADLVHQVQLTGHCDGKVLIFDGLRLSEANGRTVGVQTVPADGRSPFGGAALRCDYVSQEIAGFLHDSDEAKMRQPQHGSAWLASLLPDAPALPVRILFENPKLGMATLFLTKVEELPAS